MRILTRRLLAVLAAAALPVSVLAQAPAPTAPASSGTNPFAGSVPSGEATRDALPLSLRDAIARGLEHNLGIIAREETVQDARGARWRALSAVLPSVSGRLAADRDVINLAALGFSDFPGIEPIIGPFNVFDARLYLSQPVLDPAGLLRLRESNQRVEAAEHGVRNARDLVVLAVTNLYLQALSAESRVAAVRAQLETAETLARVAADRKSSGLVPAIDVLRSEVQRQAERQRLIVSENAAARQKLSLARAIGLPAGQALTLADAMPFVPATTPPIDQAVEQAYAHREDLKAQQLAVSAAESAAKAAAAEHLPTVGVDANWGPIGQTVGSAVPAYTVGASVRVPIFNAGATKAHAIESAGALHRRQADLADLRGRIYYEVQTALLDLDAARQEVDVATHTVDLADQQLTHARDRFGAGVADTVEVVQAQETVARAHDAQVVSLYDYNAARAALAGALGLADEDMPRFLGATK